MFLHQTSHLKHFFAVDSFSYLSVLISIVLALGMTRVLAGVGEMLQARSRRKIYWVHVIWSVNLFLFMLVAWWVFYRWRNQQLWTFFLFVFVLISPTVLYLASMVLFPREGEVDESVNYKTHFYANHRVFFIILALFAPLDVVDTLLKGVPHFLEQGPQYIVSTLIYIAGLTTAAITRNERYHQAYCIVFLVQTVVISFAIFHVLL